MIRVTPKNFAQALWNVLESNPQKIDEALDASFALINKYKLRGRLPHVFRYLRELERQAKNITSVVVTTAKPLKEEARAVIVSQLKKRFQDKSLDVAFQADPEIIGGAVIKKEGVMIDGSVVSQLKTL